MKNAAFKNRKTLKLRYIKLMNLLKVTIFITTAIFLISGFFLVSAFLEGGKPSGMLTLQTIFALGFMVYFRSSSVQSMTSQYWSGGNKAEDDDWGWGWGEKVQENTNIIHHKSPWAVIEQGKSVGRFYNEPIPEWIKTSDNRKAFFSGTSLSTLPPEECVCMENTKKAELLLSPGLIYKILSS
ncbi:MAG: hypothetical protein HQL69_16135 [Magnetococcales bacterium]|nr:hypothetical protein [Magnetococcales bacterium]